MAPQCLHVELRLLGSGSGPQTPRPYGEASCGQDALASHQGHLLLRALVLPALAV